MRRDAGATADVAQTVPEADANGDGKLTAEEAQTYRQKMVGKGKGAGKTAAVGATRPTPTHANVKYGPHERNVLDLWLAKSDQPTPLVVFIHGGGFVNGDKSGANPDAIRRCLDAGVSFMAINYRFRRHAPIQDILHAARPSSSSDSRRRNTMSTHSGSRRLAARRARAPRCGSPSAMTSPNRTATIRCCASPAASPRPAA